MNLEQMELLNVRLERKRKVFCGDVGLNGEPAIILQAGPTAIDIDVNVADSQLRSVFVGGNPDADMDRSWNGFQSTSLALLGTVDGIASRSLSNPREWAAEMHTDGYLIVGLMSLPVMGVAEKKSFVAHWHVDAFKDFGKFAASVAACLEPQPEEWVVSAAVLGASQLHYGSQLGAKLNRLDPPPIRRENLEFRLRCGPVSDLGRMANALGIDFKRAFEPKLYG